MTINVIIFCMSNETDTNLLESGTEIPEQAGNKPGMNKVLYWIIGIFVGLVLLSIVVVILISQPSVDSGRVRDIFLILMVLVSFVVSVCLIILLIQVALLVNLLNNEIRPVLANLIDSVNDLKGTTAFLSENLVEPVIKLNEYLAGFKRLTDILRPFRK